MTATGNSCFWLVYFLKSSPLQPLAQMNRDLVGSTYGMPYINFPQSRMNGERHRLSPLILQFNQLAAIEGFTVCS